MNFRILRSRLLLATLGLGAGLSVGHAGVEDTLSKSFTVSPGGTLVVAASRGSIEVTNGPADRADVQVYRQVTRTSDRKARQMIEEHQVTFAQEGNTITVRDKAPSSGLLGGWRGAGNLQVRYVITLPRQFDLDLKTAGGSITVADRAGKVVVATAGGSLKLGAIEGPVTASTSGGSVHLAAATGPVEASTAGGSIEVGQMHAATSLSTSGGSIRVKSAGQALKAGTSGGSIDIAAAVGPVQASTSGGSISVGFTASPSADCRLSTSGGSVRVRLPAGANVNLDARASGGSVKADLPVTIQGTVRKSELVGKVGNGGSLIHLRTSGGGISISGS